MNKVGATASGIKADKADGDDISQADITLRLLEVVHRDAHQTQRGIANELGIALGLVNVYLKRCVRKGLIKVSSVPARRYAYYLTLSGFAEKARLTGFYLSQSFRLFRNARTEYSALLDICTAHSWRRIGLYGIGDLTEVALLCAAERQITLAGIIDSGKTADHYLGLAVYPGLEVAPALDAVLLTGFEVPYQEWHQICAALPEGRAMSPPLLGVPSFAQVR